MLYVVDRIIFVLLWAECFWEMAKNTELKYFNNNKKEMIFLELFSLKYSQALLYDRDSNSINMYYLLKYNKLMWKFKK